MKKLLTLTCLVTLLGCSAIPGTQANANKRLGAALGNDAKLSLRTASGFSECMRRHMLEQVKGAPMAESVDHAFFTCRNSWYPGHPWPKHGPTEAPEDHPPSMDLEVEPTSLRPVHAITGGGE